MNLTNLYLGSVVARLSCLCSFHSGVQPISYDELLTDDRSVQLVYRLGCSEVEAVLYTLANVSTVLSSTVSALAQCYI